MRRRMVPVLLAALGAVVLAAASPAPPPADLVIRGGAVYTVDDARSWAEAVAVSGGKIVFVGTDAGAKTWIGPKTRVLDASGKMVLPAFHDAHVHPVSGGVEALECDLNGAPTPAAVLERVKAYAAAHPVVAMDPRGRLGADRSFPTPIRRKRSSTRSCPIGPFTCRRPTATRSGSTRRRSQLAGVTKATPDPPYGRIERDPETGEPTGTLREDAADLVAKLLPKHTAKDYADGLREGLRIANRFGLTSLVEASASEEDLEAYRTLESPRRTLGARRRVAPLRHGQGPRGGAAPRRPAPEVRRPAPPDERRQDLRRRRPRDAHGRGPRALPRVPGRPRQGEPRAGGVRRARDGPRPGRLPDPRPRDRRPRDPDVARCDRGRAPRQRGPGRAAPPRAHRAHRAGGHPALPAARRHRELSAVLGQRRQVPHRADRAQARPRAVALALPDPERRRLRRRSSPSAATGASRR